MGIAERCRMIVCLAVASVLFFVSPAVSEPKGVRLSSYAFDFPKHGYEITIEGTARNLMDKLSADDFTRIEDGGYSVKTLIDRMSRSDRQKFIAFFNAHCVGFTNVGCQIIASGEIELDKQMCMIFRVGNTSISKGNSAWSNRK